MKRRIGFFCLALALLLSGCGGTEVTVPDNPPSPLRRACASQWGRICTSIPTTRTRAARPRPRPITSSSSTPFYGTRGSRVRRSCC